MMRAAERIATDHLDNFAGTAVTGAATLTAYVVDAGGPGVDKLRALDEDSAGKIDIVRVPVSRERAAAAGRAILSGTFGFSPTYIGFSSASGRLRLQLQNQAYVRALGSLASVVRIGDPGLFSSDGQTYRLPAAAGTRQSSGSVAMDKVAEVLGIGIDVAIEKPSLPMPAATTSPRNASSAPFAMGASIRNYAGTKVCSLGVPIYISGERTVATAAHCTPMAPPTANWTKWVTPAASGNLVGSLRYSIWHSAAHGYDSEGGDWQLLGGTSGRYALDVYTGDPTSNVTNPLTGGDFTLPSQNSYTCSSGQTTGFICGYLVLENAIMLSMCDDLGKCLNVGHLVRTIHKPTPYSQQDCYGFRGGDSGGPGVREDPMRPGNYWAQSLISHISYFGEPDRPDTWERCTYYFGALRAIRLYSPTATVIE